LDYLILDQFFIFSPQFCNIITKVLFSIIEVL